MTQILESPVDRKFKMNVIDMLRALMEKLDNMQKQMGNVIRGMETLRKIKRNIRNLKCCNKLKNAFDGLIIVWT